MATDNKSISKTASELLGKMTYPVAAELLKAAVRKLFDGSRVKVIILRDREVTLKVLSNTAVWSNSEASGKPISKLTAGKVFTTPVIGLAKRNSKGSWMQCIIWHKQESWISIRHFEETTIDWGE